MYINYAIGVSYSFALKQILKKEKNKKKFQLVDTIITFSRLGQALK